MAAALDDSLRAFREDLLQFLWRQWCVIGVAGSADNPEQERWLIDPEALLAISLPLARWDVRVFDEILDWLLRNGEWINAQRLSRIARADDVADMRLIEAVAAIITERTRSPQWIPLAQPHSNVAGMPEPLFFDSGKLPTASEDEAFLKHGFRRSRFEARGMSRAIPIGDSRCLVFKMRALFGVNIRADLITHLIMLGEDYPSNAARLLGFSQKQVHDKLAEMAGSGMIHTRQSGRRVLYSLEPARWWHFLFGANDSPVKRLEWRPLARALSALLQGMESASRANSRYVASSIVRRAMERARPDLLGSRLGAPVTETTLHRGEAYLDVFGRDVRNILLYLTSGHDR